MANLAINALTGKTPVSTDLIPVADPTTGIAGKSTISQVVSTTSEDLVYSYTGTQYTPIKYAKTSPRWYGSGPASAGCHVSYIEFYGSYETTSLTLTNLISMVPAKLSYNALNSMTSISFPALNSYIGFFGNEFSGSSSLLSFSMPSLKFIDGNWSLNSFSSLTSLDVSSLETINGSFNPYGMNSLTSFNLGSLYTCGAINVNSMSSLTTLNFSSLTYCTGTIVSSSMAALTTFSLPSIVHISPTSSSGTMIGFTSGTASLTNFSIGSSIKRIGGTGGNVLFTSCALNQASVDNILVRLAALDGTGGTTAFSNRTVTITGTSSTPSATGLAAKATLVARGCTVTNN